MVITAFRIIFFRKTQYLRKMDFKTGDPFGLKFWFIPSEFYYDAEENNTVGKLDGMQTRKCLLQSSKKQDVA